MKNCESEDSIKDPAVTGDKSFLPKFGFERVVSVWTTGLHELTQPPQELALHGTNDSSLFLNSHFHSLIPNLTFGRFLDLHQAIYRDRDSIASYALSPNFQEETREQIESVPRPYYNSENRNSSILDENVGESLSSLIGWFFITNKTVPCILQVTCAERFQGGQSN